MVTKLNPIRVTKDGKNLKIIESNKEFKDGSVTKIKIVTLSDNPIHKGFLELNNELFLDLDINLSSVKILYYSEEEYVDFEIIELIETIVNENELSPEELEYEEIKSKINDIMDMPKGTELEISKHTELLKKTTIDENARVYATSKIRKELIQLNVDEDKIEPYTYRLYGDLYGMGVLQELDDDETVGEIMLNARTFPKFHCDIYFVRNQQKIKYHKTFKTLKEMENVFRKVLEFSKKEINSTDNAMIEATRPNKDRVNIIIPDASENWILNIRKFSNFVPNMEMMKKSGTIDEFNDRLFKVLVQGLANIGIGGYMGTGKTTLINFLLTYTNPDSLKVVIASVSETDVDRVLKGHHVAILNVDDEKGFTFEKHLKFSLRTTAERIVVPESRGEEFKQIYEANLKTSGNMFTAHALDDEAFMDMCVEMYKSSPTAQSENAEYVKTKLAKSMDIIVIMRRVGSKIRIKSISEVIVEDGKFAGLNKLQEWDFSPENPLEGQYIRTEHRLSDRLKRKLNENGIPMKDLEDL
ncbi:ATPase, T2SS/T4P/T4SS family [Clostridium disporicum]|uniref:ATPase, T2SS/T4P/T4SS family n=1 Tax=Clostridium disporicum TaxID=84024 RepID=UPI0034A4C0DE